MFEVQTKFKIIGHNNARSFEEATRQIAGEYPDQRVTVDLSGVEFRGTAAIDVLRSLRRDLGTRFLLTKVPGPISTKIRTTGFDTLLDTLGE